MIKKLNNIYPLNVWKKFFSKNQQILLGALVFIGLGIRVMTAVLGQISRDEVHPFLIARDNSLINLIVQNYWDTCHPPLYYIFLHFWQKIYYNPIFLRLPSLTASFFILTLIPVLAYKLLPKNKHFPFLALFLFSFSQSQVFVNVIARPYSWAILFMIVSLIGFVDLINQENISNKKIVGLATVNFLMFFTDYSSVWLFLSFGVFSVGHFFLIKNNFKKAFLRNATKYFVLSTVFLEIVSLYLVKGWGECFYQLRYLKELFMSPNPIQSNLWQLQLLSSVTVYDLPIVSKIITLDIWAIFMVMMGFLGLFLMMIKNKKTSLLLLTIFFTPILTAFLFSLKISPIFRDRNLIILNVVLILGWAYLFSKISKKIKIFLLIVLVFWLLNFKQSFPGLYYAGYPYDWLGAVKALKAYEKSTVKEIITSDPEYRLAPLLYYGLLEKVSNIKIVTTEKSIPISKTKKALRFILFISEKPQPSITENHFLNIISKKMDCRLIEKKIKYLYFAQCQ